MTSLVFVHGTGVRRAAFDKTLALVTTGVRGRAPVVPCYWGEPFGSSLRLKGASIPDGLRHRGPGEPDEVELWRLLELDPLLELRLLGTAAPVEAPVNEDSPGRRLRRVAARALDDPDLRAAVAAAGLTEFFAPALTAVLESPALDVAGAGQALAGAAARAAVAETLARADEAAGMPVPVDGAHRDAVVAALLTALGADTRGIGTALLSLAMRPVDRRRFLLTSAASPAAGDIMVYLARGAAIREHIASVAAAQDDGVILLAHSLGGIACVDLLATAPPPNVRALVTVGSQAPYLHELGALPGLEPGAELPDTFPVPWYNVMDQRDLLSFYAEPVFGDRVRDVELDSRVPFPRSHSAYFTNDGLYALLGHILDAVT
ncbi:hypothetical protein [Dactylosporangium sp. CA-233914]|uniref:hypothetical protein n=1 Tax=Dactylosporangium sp. CA-233914 TaxID=3239934 RepID=UPI003D916263